MHKKKNFNFLKSKYFLYFIIFYIYILINSALSDYASNIFLKNLFYIRYIIFIFAVLHIFQFNKEILLNFSKCLFFTLLVVCLDGFFQYFTGENILGYEIYRVDRLSGFFGDDLVLGSYLSKFLSLSIAVFFLNNKSLSKIETVLAITIIFLTFTLILLSGERASLLSAILSIILILIFINSYKIYRLIFFLVIILISISVLSFDKIMLERYFNQTISQLKPISKSNNFFDNFRYYSPIFETAFKGFKEKKFIGQGAKSFRYFCDKKGLETFFDEKMRVSIIDNEQLSFINDWKIKNVKIEKIYFKEGENIKKGDIFLSYSDKKNFSFFNLGRKEKLIDFVSNRSGIVNKIHAQEGQIISGSANLAEIKITDKNISKQEKIIHNGCTTHPHQYYLQLLSETGFLGFFYIFSIFIIFSFKLINNAYNKIIYKRIIFNNYQICLIINIIVLLWPITTNGDFFNNWNNMLMLLPIAAYLYSKKNYYAD